MGKAKKEVLVSGINRRNVLKKLKRYEENTRLINELKKELKVKNK
jgi:hypothetical protein